MIVCGIGMAGEALGISGRKVGLGLELRLSGADCAITRVERFTIVMT
jgi:hypothetical protein